VFASQRQHLFARASSPLRDGRCEIDGRGRLRRRCAQRGFVSLVKKIANRVALAVFRVNAVNRACKPLFLRQGKVAIKAIRPFLNCDQPILLGEPGFVPVDLCLREIDNGLVMDGKV
jgi:hypothetical protein